MTTNTNFERNLNDWLDHEAGTAMPHYLDEVLAQTQETTQRRAPLWAPRLARLPLISHTGRLVAALRRHTMHTSFNGMRSFAVPLLAAVALVVAVSTGVFLAGNSGFDFGGPAIATPSPAPSATAPPASALLIPTMSETFTSVRHGYSVGYPAGSTVEPASAANEGRDFIRGPDPVGVFRADSTVAPEGVSIDDWIDESLTPAAGDCSDPGYTLSDIPIDGQAGRVRHGCPEEVEAVVAAGGRVYIFTLFHDGPEARAAFDAFAATIDLRPEDAVDVATPRPS